MSEYMIIPFVDEGQVAFDKPRTGDTSRLKPRFEKVRVATDAEKTEALRALQPAIAAVLKKHRGKMVEDGLGEGGIAITLVSVSEKGAEALRKIPGVASVSVHSRNIRVARMAGPTATI